MVNQRFSSFQAVNDVLSAFASQTPNRYLKISTPPGMSKHRKEALQPYEHEPNRMDRQRLSAKR